MNLLLRDVAFLEHGPTVTLTVEPGQTLCVVGPAGAGKSKLLRVIAKSEPADRGAVGFSGKAVVPEPCNRKLRPQDVSHRKGSNRAALATDVLSQLGLWEVRQKVIGELPPGQIAACDLLEIFMGDARLVVLDGDFDRLDPWARQGALRLMRDCCSRGAIFVVATDHVELAAQFDWLVVMREHQPVYSGRVSELAATRGQRSVTIESERNRGVRALVEPLLVSVARTETGYHLQPGPGQEHTAKLLRDGYGDVKYVVTDEKPLAEIVLELVNR
jgi:ABC-type multidrug transport system ATPase subunit